MYMEPLEILFRLFTPLAAPLRKQAYPVHLDALLIAIMSAREGRKYDPCEDDPYAPGTGRVPLAVAGSKRPVYQASVGLVSGRQTEGSRYAFTRRAPSPELVLARETRSRKGATYTTSASSGWRKAWSEAVATVTVAPTVAFRCVGNIDAVRSLLDRVAALGPFRRCGLGEVVEVTVRAVDADPATWGLVNEEGVPMRELPVEDWPQPMSPGWIQGVAAARPPYWYPGNREVCWLPDPFAVAVPHALVLS